MSPVLKPAKLLLVDDKPANLLALESVLESGPYTLIFAHSGKEALMQLERHPDIALILLDIQMPELDGFEVAKRIKAMPERRDIPIILITAIHTDSPFVIKGYQSGAIDYFSKPFDPEILKLKVGIYASFRQKAELLRERERQIKESEELIETGRKLTSILDSPPMGVVVAGLDGKICQANDEGLRFWRMFGQSGNRSDGDLDGWQGQPGRPPAGIDGPLMRTLTTRRPSSDEFVHRNRVDGTSRSIFASASPLRGRDGHMIGAVVIIQDVTDHKRAEGDFEKRIQHLVAGTP